MPWSKRWLVALAAGGSAIGGVAAVADANPHPPGTVTSPAASGHLAVPLTTPADLAQVRATDAEARRLEALLADLRHRVAVAVKAGEATAAERATLAAGVARLKAEQKALLPRPAAPVVVVRAAAPAAPVAVYTPPAIPAVAPVATTPPTVSPTTVAPTTPPTAPHTTTGASGTAPHTTTGASGGSGDGKGDS